MLNSPLLYSLFFFNDTATTEIYTLSLHDALPICEVDEEGAVLALGAQPCRCFRVLPAEAALGQLDPADERSEEHTSELQSHLNLVCRLLLEKKKNTVTSRSLTPLPTSPATLHAST